MKIRLGMLPIAILTDHGTNFEEKAGIHQLIERSEMGIREERKFIVGDATKDITFTTSRTFATDEEAKEMFNISVERLFAVDRWTDLPGISSRFELHDEDGEKKEAARPKVGDHIKIILPGVPLDNWVAVTEVKERDGSAEFTVSPCNDPKATGEERKQIKHFFTAGATSTFRVELEGGTITAWEIGRNEGINNKGEEAGGRKVVNTLIAEGGWAGFQRLQWEKLTNYLVDQLEIEE